MLELQWVETDLQGVFDLVDEAGRQLGYVMPCRGKYFVGYYIRPGRKEYRRRSAFLRTSDNLPTEAAARAWVEGEARKGGADA